MLEFARVRRIDLSKIVELKAITNKRLGELTGGKLTSNGYTVVSGEKSISEHKDILQINNHQFIKTNYGEIWLYSAKETIEPPMVVEPIIETIIEPPVVFDEMIKTDIQEDKKPTPKKARKVTKKDD